MPEAKIVLRAKKTSHRTSGSFKQFDPSGIVHGTTCQFVAHVATHDSAGPRDIPVGLRAEKIDIEYLLKAARGGSHSCRVNPDT
ncbi:hypothetical protein [Paraburkholderia graminis]|uniref:hypothetical protein n=1 Tax=Paraburkholderia graminis TaxID=60548 RepID=UPI0038BA5897